MKKTLILFILLIGTLASRGALAILNMELTQGFSGAVPIAIVPFAIQGETPSQDIVAIINNDLQNSGRFKVYDIKHLTHFPSDVNEVPFDYFNHLHVDNIVVGKVQQMSQDRYQITVQLLDAAKGKNAPGSVENSILFDKKFIAKSPDLRSLAHHISDLIYQQITSVRGIFSTRLAYIVVQRKPHAPAQYVLEIADQDGAGPRSLLVSSEPIMSPSWSPDGNYLAYVSFENKRAAIYIEEVATGSRHLISEFSGINGAPAWSPDGRKLALVLSKSGAPNIYMMDLQSHHLTQLTHDFYINTEPAWSPDGRAIIFTSNRGGGPQIYQINLANQAISRVTYDGNYNARASFTPDGNHIVVLNQNNGLFNIGILDLDAGTFRILTHSGTDHESPSTAPNGTMVLFGTYYQGHNILGMVTTDGSVHLRLPARNGDVQDPAWSPFLS